MRGKTKELTITALLTALAIIIPQVMPIKVVQPPFTATLASHTPLIIAMFISPLAAVLASLGSAVGFFFTFGPIVAARAATHIFFALAGAYMIRKKSNPTLIVIITMILHAVTDMGIVYIMAVFFGMDSILKSQAMSYVQGWLGIGTVIHHMIDFLLSYIILLPLSKAKIITSSYFQEGSISDETVSSHQ